MMEYIALTTYLQGNKFYVSDKKVKNRIATNDEVTEFCNILSVNRRYETLISITNSANSFFKAASDIAKLFPDIIHDDLFYSVKNGVRYDGVPSKLLYLILRAKDMYKYPNLSMSMIKRQDILNFCVEGILPEGLTVWDIVQNVWKSDVLPLTGRRLKAIYSGMYEVYVPTMIMPNGDKVDKFDQVAVVNSKIIDRVSDINWRTFYLKEDVGLIANNTILRYLDGMYGVVKDDLILTEVHDFG